MTRYDEIMGGKPARTRQNAGTIPTTYHQASDKLSAASRLMLISLLLIAMLTGGAAEAWGQITDGVYYVRITSKSDLVYMCPALEDKTTGQPYLSGWNDTTFNETVGETTYSFDATYFKWIVKQVTVNSQTYYLLINIYTDKYLVWDTYTSGNARAVHLETKASEPTQSSDKCFYSIYVNGSDHYVHPDQCTNNNTLGLNYKGDFTTTDLLQHRDNNYRGLIQFYNNTKNKIESAPLLDAPTISYNSETNKFTISYDKIPVGFDILYTTDGSEPSIGGATTTTVTTTTQPNTSEITVTGTYTVNAVIARHGVVLTSMASQPVGVPNDPTITLPTDCNNIVDMSAGGAIIFYTLDGSNPDNSSTLYSGPFVLNEDATIKAIAYNGTLHSGVTTVNYMPPYSTKPTISRNGVTVTVSGIGNIYYTTDGSDPDTESTLYNGPITLTDGTGTMTIKAVAKDGSKGLSCVEEKSFTLGYFISSVSDFSKITSNPDALFIVTSDFSASSLNESIDGSGFTGTFDGGYYTISGLTKPLFTNLNGGTVKNVRLSEVNIPSGSNVGAICDEAGGTTKIYNCGILSGSVTGSSNVGGLVGLIKSGSSVRVVNCYNYADVTGGSYAAGIVGKNEGTVASDKTVGNVRIALCMMYGSVSGATHISPVYGGNHVSNVQNFTEYNYYLYSNERNTTTNERIVKVPYTTVGGVSDYNDQMAIDKDDYLKRFPFYRHIMNTHRRLAAFFLFGNASSNDAGSVSNENVNEIGHWGIDKSLADNPYPIIEEWQTNTRKILDAPAGITVSVRDGDGSAITSLAVDMVFSPYVSC